MSIHQLLLPLVLCGVIFAPVNQTCAQNNAGAGEAVESPGKYKDKYVVVVSESTKANKEWMDVANALASKRDAKILTYKKDINTILSRLRKDNPRMMALVAPPSEINRSLVNSLHRLTRQLDDDPYGDCIWGIITGYSPADAMRQIHTTAPLVITRAEATTLVGWQRFEKSYVITDHGAFEEMEQEGYVKPKKVVLPESEEGMAFKFADYWKKINPQLVVTSSHATQYNLEMPFSKGAIISFKNRFHILDMEKFKEYASFLKGVLFEGKEEDLEQFVKESNLPTMEPDDSPKVWIACGNCLFGDAKESPNTMVITALSAYGCNQVIGYTVPTWYGKGGWGTLDLFFNNHEGTTFAKSWYLNNQFILHETNKRFPDLMKVSFNARDMQSAQKEDSGFMKAVSESSYGVGKDQMGLVHDRDVVAFYGDPAWVASLDETHGKSPWRVQWNDESAPESGFLITANRRHKGRFSVWFPRRIEEKEAFLMIGEEKYPVRDVGLLTNDFILIDALELEKGAQGKVVFGDVDKT